MAELDLNDKKLLDYGDGTPFLPYDSARYVVNFESVQFKEGFQGKAYLFKFEVTESDHPQVKAGSKACLRFPIDGDGVKLEINRKKIRQILAAIAGEDPRNPDFDATTQLTELVAAGEDAKELGVRLQIDASMRETVPKQGKNAGQKVERTNYYYKNLAAA